MEHIVMENYVQMSFRFWYKVLTYCIPYARKNGSFFFLDYDHHFHTSFQIDKPKHGGEYRQSI